MASDVAPSALSMINISNAQRRSAALSAAELCGYSAPQVIDALSAMGLASTGDDGRLHSSTDQSGVRWWSLSRVNA